MSAAALKSTVKRYREVTGEHGVSEKVLIHYKYDWLKV